MPVSQTAIDRFTDTIATQLGKVQVETIKALLLLYEGSGATDEFITIMNRLNVKEVMIQKSQNVFRLYNDGLAVSLKDTISFAQISENTLKSLAELERLRFLEEIGSMASDVKKVVIQGVMTNKNVSQMVEELRRVYPYSQAQLTATINTGLNAYSRTVTKIMMDKLPQKQKYIYVGAIDDRTRPECLEYWSAGAITLDEINSRGWSDSLVNGGGFNCRHQWTIEEAGTPFYDVRSNPEDIPQ